jgi:hypothetical protein
MEPNGRIVVRVPIVTRTRFKSFNSSGKHDFNMAFYTVVQLAIFNGIIDFVDHYGLSFLGAFATQHRGREFEIIAVIGGLSLSKPLARSDPHSNVAASRGPPVTPSTTWK